VTGFGKVHRREFLVASGDMNESEFTVFLKTIFAQLVRNAVDGSLHFVCMDWQHLTELISSARSVYTELTNLCIWMKDSAAPGSLYRSQHQLVFVFKSGKEPQRNKIQLGQYGRYRSNVWQYRDVNSSYRGTDEGNLSDLHPAIKPVELVADAILDCTSRGDVVLDPFGSGTTLIAAERTGRICYGVELDPRCVDTIVRRWQAFTGQSAVQESTGRTFDEIEQERYGESK